MLTLVAKYLISYLTVSWIAYQDSGSKSWGQEEAESGTPDRAETHTRKYFTGTRASTIKNDIAKEPINACIDTHPPTELRFVSYKTLAISSFYCWAWR